MKTLISAVLAAAVLIAPASLAHAADKVRFGSIRVPVQIFVGMKMGFFEEQGIEVEPVFYKSGSEIAPALATDQVDAAFTTSGAALFNALARGAKITIVAEALALEPEAPGGDPTAIVLRSDLIKNPQKPAEDLKGKTLATTAPGQILDIMIKAYLKKIGLSPSDVKIVGMPMPDIVPALSNGALDGAIVIDPFLSALVEAGKVKVLARSSEILPNASQAFLALSDSMRQRQDLSVRFVRAYLKTNGWMRQALASPDGRKEIAAIFQEFVPARSAEVYELIALGTASASAEINVDGEYGLKWQLQVLKDEGLIKGDPDLDAHLDSDLLKRAGQE
ncbi:ABC transporter substrate-binding protein [Rhizobium alvei]|uniref:ABC transporter substrate-binding protein n=1 Tax=Rhizobium alvei TaxID=1132659 RepID=A0ABT8YS65_9HYPH|nr:ABC transporter substrate-binding protein [Rhizobium alvei]MDO6966144.1 ABC transporter substrate-binding protein [Rhizobium alvei]